MIKLHTDGACITQKGIMGIGYVIEIDKEKYTGYKLLDGHGTNNIAEYSALVEGLAETLRLLKPDQDHTIHIYSDSQLMVNQILGKYKIKNNNLRVLNHYVLAALTNFNWKIEWIPREHNTEADALSKEATKEAVIL